jgi:hypothetical protein
MATRRYQVMGLPYRRSLEELPGSPFLKLLNADQARALGTWLRAADVGEQWQACWVGEERLVFVDVKRVA